MSSSTTAPVLINQRGAVRVITLNRPEKLNAFSNELLDQLEIAVSEACEDNATKAIVLAGAGGKAFSAGNDISRLAGLDAMQAHADMARGQRLMLRLHEAPKPTIAMVGGYALGGGFELALACNFIVASSKAVFGFPEIRLDTLPGWGGTQLAVAKLGMAHAMEMVLSGQLYPMAQCEAWGLVSRVCAPDALEDETLAFASLFTNGHPFAVRMAKQAVLRAGELPLAAGMDFEAACYTANFGTPHALAGLEAFLQQGRKKTK